MMALFDLLIKNVDCSLVALETESSSLTYGELLSRATSSSVLFDFIDNANSLICIRMSHSIVSIQLILSFIYANKSFVPINSSASLSELAHVLDETKACLIFTDQIIPEYCSRLVFEQSNLYVYDLKPKSSLSVSSPLIIFTSGTTSKPKGVLIGSDALFANISAVANNFALSSSDKTLIYSPPAYAMAFTQIFSYIYASAVIIPYSFGLKFPSHLISYCKTRNITGLTISLSLLKLIHSQLESVPQLPSVRYISGGGMPIYQRDLRLFSNLCPNARIINFYGCTENSPRIAHYWVDNKINFSPDDLIPVGEAINGVKIMLEPVSASCDISQILVSGTSLSHGYLNNSELTNERFIDGWYKTGDLGYICDNLLYVTGRIDNVFSVSHEKLEPEEVESVINSHPSVFESIVVPIPDIVLCNIPAALVVLNSPSPSSPTFSFDLRSFLSTRVSSYKVPLSIHFVSTIPKTLYGKLDRKAALALLLKLQFPLPDD